MNIFSITKAAHEYGHIAGYATPLEFARKEISFAHDVSARQERFELSLTPYLKDVLEQWDFRGKGHREVVIMAIEQTGKSLSWMLGLLWSFIYEPGLSMVVYPSDEKSDEINRAKLQPMMRGIPSLAAGMAAPFSKGRNRYSFPAFISYFQGAVERISAHSARIMIADEVDDWMEMEGRAESRKLDDLRKRGRTFDDSMLSIVSSPKGGSPIIAGEFAATSRGHWHLRCLGCGGLTMRSADVHNLQFETSVDDSGEKAVIAGSERLTCPKCKREHEYGEAKDMNLAGAFVHRDPSLVGRKTGFQWGALASQWHSLDWTFIAERQLSASARADVRDQANFDNSIRGLPFRPRRTDAPAVVAIRSHCADQPAEDQVEGLFFSADTQDDCWYWIVRAVLKDESTALLAYGRAMTETDLDTAWKSEHYGFSPIMGIIDEGGHRAREVQAFVSERRGMMTYKGNPRIGKRQAVSHANQRLLLVMPTTYQAELLYWIYTQMDRDKSYWYLPRQVSEEYVSQIASMRENAKVREGNQYEKWTPVGPDHYFDCEKQVLALIEYAKMSLPAAYWISKEPPWARKKRKPKVRPRRHGGWLKG